MSLRVVSLGACFVLIAACGNNTVTTTSGSGGAGGESAGVGAASSGDIPCDVHEILVDKCQSCHGSTPQFGAPMALVTRDDLRATSSNGSATMAELSVARMQGESGSMMPPPPNEQATSAEIGAVRAWIDAGYPARAAGEMCQGGTGGGNSGIDCNPDISLQGQTPFEMPADSIDEQVCFGIDVPTGDLKRHITTIAPRIDNSTIIHHILLLQAPNSVSPDPTPCNFVDPDWKLLYAWGPGTPPHALPDEAGFPMEAGETTHFVLQVHYNNLTGLVGETDLSGVDLCTTTDLRQHDADIMAFGSTDFSGVLPMARSQLECTLELPSQVDAVLPITIFQSWPHMHTVGQELHSWLSGPSGERRLVDVDDYDFDYQITYPNNNVQLQSGDTIHTTCIWNNNTPIERSFGEGTNDEMCFNFVSYYPRIELPFWNWIAPSFASNCSMSTL